MVGVLPPQDEQDEQDRHSVHSIASTVTVATTTSLASRIRDLNFAEHEFHDDADAGKEGAPSAAADRNGGLCSPPHDHGGTHAADEAAERGRLPAAVAVAAADGGAGAGAAEGDARRGSAGALAEEDLAGGHGLHLLRFRDPPLQVCCRLFERRSHPPLALKRMSMVQVEDFRQHGYVVVDNLISREAAARIKAEALRLSARGLLQPVGAANLGVLSVPPQHAQQPVPGSSPCSTCSSTSQHGGGLLCGSLSQQAPGAHSNGGASHHHQQQQQQQQQQHAALHQLMQQQWGELRMPLALGQPPADTAVFAPVLAALQDLQDDLSEFVRLRSKGGAEYCLSLLPPGVPALPRHRDALPDDGRGGAGSGSGSFGAAAAAGGGQQNGAAVAVASPTGAAAAAADGGGGGGTPSSGQQQQQPVGPQARRVSVFVFLNPDWEREGGGGLRLWPPQRPVGPASATAASAAARRSPTSSDAGTTFSEISDCGSLRVPFLGSTTSSVVAEASAPDHDTYSLDGLSVADSDAERQGFEWSCVDADGCEMVLDIAPFAGRVVMLLSGAVEHALLPAGGGGGGPSAHMAFVRAWCS